MVKLPKWQVFLVLIGLLLLGVACDNANPTLSESPSMQPTFTPFQPIKPTSADETGNMLPVHSPDIQFGNSSKEIGTSQTVYFSPAVPESFRVNFPLPKEWQISDKPENSILQIIPSMEGAISWVYALVAPFPTVEDGTTLEDLIRIWRGDDTRVLLVTPDTYHAMIWLLGQSGNNVVQVRSNEELLSRAWQEHTLAIIPFEEITPRWKVLQVGGKSPLAKGEIQNYALEVHFAVKSESTLPEGTFQWLLEHRTNRDPESMTVLMLTGTTALVRAIGWKMETMGMSYPARDILDWLLEPDFLHISNEVSFNPQCPPADPNQTSLMFCSRPEYLDLFRAIDVEIIELSGNHNNDWGRNAFAYSLEQFQKEGWLWYAGGQNAQEANQPLLLEHNGNRIALLGCNHAGPPTVWATENEPGAAKCDFGLLENQIQSLREEGYLPVITLQHSEVYQSPPSDTQVRDFRRLAQAGAVIVSGSQAHFPQAMEFYEGAFIHYGLGNLFFDQMDIPVQGTRREFLDRHVFYKGKHINTQLYTAMLEDYARPRPMTAEERVEFLRAIFDAGGW